MTALPPLATAEIIAVGSELLVPPRLDTNSLTVTTGLATLGIQVGAKHVVGLDVSPKAIELAWARSLINGVADRVDFICAPAETAVPQDGPYDIVWCNAILHHLTDNLDIVLKNITGWVKPGGVISFAEPTNFNDTLRALRKLIPIRSGAVTADERPLEPRDIAIIRKWIPSLKMPSPTASRCWIINELRAAAIVLPYSSLVSSADFPR